MLGRKVEPSNLSDLNTKKTFLTHHTLPVRVGAKQSAPYCHLGTQNDSGSTIYDIASHSVSGRETFQCLSLDLLHAPAKCKRARKCYMPSAWEGGAN